MWMYRCNNIRRNIGAGTSPAGPAMAGPFSAVYALDFRVVAFPDWIVVVKSGWVRT